MAKEFGKGGFTVYAGGVTESEYKASIKSYYNISILVKNCIFSQGKLFMQWELKISIVEQKSA